MEITVFLLVLLCAEAATEYRANCTTHPVEAEEGDNVDLPCRLNPPFNMSTHTMDWKRADLNKVVHLYRHRKDDPDPQKKQYRNRTKLNHKDLSRGILNLQISSVQQSDSGPYKCNVPTLMASCVITLSVVKKDQNRTKGDDFSTKRPAVEKESQPDEKKVDVGAIVGGVCGALFLALIGVLVKVLKSQNCVEKLGGRKVQQTETVANGLEEKKLNSQTAEEAETQEGNIVTTEV